MDSQSPVVPSSRHLIDAIDWSASVLGEPARWPISLKSLVRVMLGSEFPMFVAWGPELGFLYNDAYARILGDKHPAAFGGRFQDIWPEIWSDIAPIVVQALQGKASYFEDLPLTVKRSGAPEQAWFTFSYSPVQDDAGRIAGMYCAVVETSKQVRERQRKAFQLHVADELNSLATPNDIVDTVVSMLGQRLQASRCWYAKIDAAAARFTTMRGWALPGQPALPEEGSIAAFCPALADALHAGLAFRVTDVVTDERTRDTAAAFAALAIRSMLVVPVLKNGVPVFNINLCKAEPYAWCDDEVELAFDVADRTWFAMDNAVAQHRLAVELNLSDHILNSMAEGFVLISDAGAVRTINAMGAQMLGRPAPAWIGIDPAALWSEGVRPAVAEAMAAAVASVRPQLLEIMDAPPGQAPRWLELRLDPMDGHELAIFFRDVTHQKHAALAVQRSERHLAALFEQTSAGIAERDLHGRIIRVNDRLCAILGRPARELLGMDVHALTHPDDVVRADAAFQKLLADGQPFHIEKRYLRADGAAVWVSTSVSLIRNPGDGSAGTVLAVVLDITEKKAAEDALRDETRILDLLNRSGQALASTLDLQALLQIITDSGRELIGAEIGAFFYNGRDESGQAMQLYTLSGAPRAAFERFGHPRATPVFHPTFHGSPLIRSDDITADPRYGTMAPHFGLPAGHLPVRSYLAASVVARSGEVLGGLFFAHAQPARFTERSERIISGLVAQAAIAIDNARLYKMAQNAAEQRSALLASETAARAEAEHLNRSKDEFLAMLAHELRNPLAPVGAAAEILRLAPSDPHKVRQVSDIITRQIGHFTRIIDDLMDVSRVTRGLESLDAEALDLKVITANALEQVRPMIEARQHRLTTRIAAEHAIVRGDRTRLVQVVANLLTNAAKYTPPQGEIGLTVEVAGSMARIVVKDNGNGIDGALLPRVFDLFTQGMRGLDRAQGGLGIGLALVKAIVGLHHGKVGVVSDGPGTGSTFTVELPLFAETLAPAEQDSPSTVGVRRNILIVDDNADAADALAILLTAVGHAVTTAASARAALGLPQLAAFDVFVLDIGLPDMDGYRLVQALRARTDLRAKAFFALTGYGQPEDRQLAKEAGFTRHFVKPVDNRELLRALAACAPVLDEAPGPDAGATGERAETRAGRDAPPAPPGRARSA